MPACSRGARENGKTRLSLTHSLTFFLVLSQCIQRCYDAQYYYRYY